MVSPFAPVKIEPVAKQAATKTLRREDIPNIAVSGMDSTLRCWLEPAMQENHAPAVEVRANHDNQLGSL